MTRTLLFLHTEFPTREVLQRLRPPGRLVLATDQVTPEDTAFYDEVIALPPVERVAETVRRLAHVEADELVVQTEYGLLAGSIVGRSRGLRAPSPATAHLTTNKYLCLEVLAAAGVRVPRFALAETASDVRRFADGQFPVVVKPVASTLGHLVAKVETEAEVDTAVAALRAALPESPHTLRLREFARLVGVDLGCDPARQFLVQEFVAGAAVETDGLVFGEAIDLFGVTEQVVCPPPHFFIQGYLFPVDLPAVEAASRAAIRALGLRDAGFSIEFRGDVLIEVNGRLGEDAGFPDLFHAGIGHYPILKWVEGDATPSRRRPGGSAVAYASWYRDGIVRAVPTAEEARGATLLAAPGRRLYAPPNPEIAPHLAWALASHPGGSRAAYAEARAVVDALRFEIEDLPCGS